jgi:hypothetical protein
VSRSTATSPDRNSTASQPPNAKPYNEFYV